MQNVIAKIKCILLVFCIFHFDEQYILWQQKLPYIGLQFPLLDKRIHIVHFPIYVYQGNLEFQTLHVIQLQLQCKCPFIIETWDDLFVTPPLWVKSHTYLPDTTFPASSWVLQFSPGHWSSSNQKEIDKLFRFHLSFVSFLNRCCLSSVKHLFLYDSCSNSL